MRSKDKSELSSALDEMRARNKKEMSAALSNCELKHKAEVAELSAGIKQRDNQINLRKNNSERVVLYDTDEIIAAKIENFKDKPAVLTMIQHIPGQWDMAECNMQYTKKDAYTLEFEIELPARTDTGPAVKELTMHYYRRNVRP